MTLMEFHDFHDFRRCVGILDIMYVGHKILREFNLLKLKIVRRSLHFTVQTLSGTGEESKLTADDIGV